MFEISDFFPEISAIEDENLRGSIKDCWVIACRENNIKDLSKVPWLPPVQKDLNIKNESLVNHVRDVVSLSVGIADSLKDSRNTDIDYDLLIGGCLIHDISKLYEFDGMKETDTYRLLGHPYYGIYCVSKAGLPIEYSHIVLSHAHRTNVEPMFLEANIIKNADEIAATTIRKTKKDNNLYNQN